jgi:hypothetical protein
MGTLAVWTGETTLALFGSAGCAFGLYAWVNTAITLVTFEGNHVSMIQMLL